MSHGGVENKDPRMKNTMRVGMIKKMLFDMLMLLPLQNILILKVLVILVQHMLKPEEIFNIIKIQNN